MQSGNHTQQRLSQATYIVAAYIAIAFALLGLLLPVLPTTPFLLIAIWAAGKGSQRVHDWIYRQPRFARLLNAWQTQRAVPTSAKWLASAMMLGSWLILLFKQSHWLLLLSCFLLFLSVSVFLWTRPNPADR